MPSVITVGGSASLGSGYSFGDLVEKVYRRVMSGVSELTVQLGGYIDGVQTTLIPVTGVQTSAIVPGAILGVELELMLVLSVNTSANQISVERGYMGSIATAHNATTLVYINPSLSKFDCAVAINDDLNSLSAEGLVRINSAEIVYNPIFMGYDLGAIPTNFTELLELRYKIPFPSKNYPPITRWHISRYQDTTVFPSGNSLTIYEPGYPGMPMFATYAAPLLPFYSFSDNICNTPATNDQDPPYNGYPTVASYQIQGTVSTGSQFITAPSSLTNIALGQQVIGAGIPNGTFVTAVNNDLNIITMSNYATGSFVSEDITLNQPGSLPNLPATATDIPIIGATIQLMQAREFSRNSFMVQPDPRKATDVPAGAIMNSTQRMEIWREKRIREEVERIRKQYSKLPTR